MSPLFQSPVPAIAARSLRQSKAGRLMRWIASDRVGRLAPVAQRLVQLGVGGPVGVADPDLDLRGGDDGASQSRTIRTERR